MIDIFGRRAVEIPDFDFTERISFDTARARVRKYRGLPAEYNCAFCFEEAQEWAYRGRSQHEQSGTVPKKQNKGGRQAVRWSPNPMDYIPLCTDCRLKRTQAVHGVAER